MGASSEHQPGEAKGAEDRRGPEVGAGLVHSVSSLPRVANQACLEYSERLDERLW